MRHLKGCIAHWINAVFSIVMKFCVVVCIPNDRNLTAAVSPSDLHFRGFPQAIIEGIVGGRGFVFIKV